MSMARRVSDLRPRLFKPVLLVPDLGLHLHCKGQVVWTVARV